MRASDAPPCSPFNTHRTQGEGNGTIIAETETRPVEAEVKWAAEVKWPLTA
jgi:hypothetical protein